MRTKILASVAMIALTGAALPAFAEPGVAKLPEGGKARFEVVYFRAGPGHHVQVDDQTAFGTFEQYGTTRNLDGKPWFDRMSEYCTGQYYEAVGKPLGATNGSCIYVDRDGDKLTINWVDAGDGGTKEVVGGTGKYSGITGKGTYSFVSELAAPTEGSRMFLVNVELDFALKRSS